MEDLPKDPKTAGLPSKIGGGLAMKNTRIMLIAGLLIGAMLTVPSAHAQMGISNDGVVFPDGTVQTTAASPEIYAIGETGPAGGFVFHVTDDGLHGLEAAPVDQSIGAAWGCAGTNIVGANAVALGKGARNTDDILHGCETAGIAAAAADGYVSPSGYYDWYLPSKDELDKMYTELDFNGLGGFASAVYWSSSEFSLASAWGQVFGNGFQAYYSKNFTYRVRAVRAF